METGSELTETWTTRDLPILRAALRRLDAGAQFADLEEIRVELGFDTDAIWAGVHALEAGTPPYVTAQYMGGWGAGYAGGTINAVSERARRELGTWPSPERLVDQLATALRTAADQEPEQERKTRLRATAEALGGFARAVAVEVVARQIGG